MPTVLSPATDLILELARRHLMKTAGGILYLGRNLQPRCFAGAI